MRREDFVPPSQPQSGLRRPVPAAGPRRSHDEAGGRRPRAAGGIAAARRERAGDRHRVRVFSPLAWRVWPAEVVSVEQHADFAESARTRLHAANVRNAKIEVAEAVRDFAPAAPVRRDGCHWRRACAAATLARLDQARRPPVRVVGDIAGATRDVARAPRRQRGTSKSLFETDMPYLSHAAPPKLFVL